MQQLNSVCWKQVLIWPTVIQILAQRLESTHWVHVHACQISWWDGKIKEKATQYDHAHCGECLFSPSPDSLFREHVCPLKLKGKRKGKRNWSSKQAKILFGKISLHEKKNLGSMVLGPGDQNQQERPECIRLNWYWGSCIFLLGSLHIAYVLHVI